MLRKLIKTEIASALHWVAVDDWIGTRRGLNNMPLVISYHRVVEDFHNSAIRSISPMLITVKTLERQLDWIGQRYDFISLDDLAGWSAGDVKFRRPVAAITFDDGYSDVYEHGFPVLRRKGIPSAIFVVTDHVGNTHMQIHDELYLRICRALSQWAAPEREFGHILQDLDIPSHKAVMMVKNVKDPFRFTRVCLEQLCQDDLRRIISGLCSVSVDIEDMSREFYSVTWDMLREMLRGDVTVGSHTRSHALLVNETGEKVFDEVYASRIAVEQMLGTPIKHFAYPDGRFNKDVIKAVRDAGYRCAYTTCLHRDKEHPQLTIPRKVLWENSSMDAFYRFSPAMMSCQVNGVFDLVRGCPQAHGV